MKSSVSKYGIGALIALLSWINPVASQSTRTYVTERIGVYDSRAVAIAFAGSSFQQQRMNSLKEAHLRAKESGASGEMARLVAEVKKQQADLHLQGFSTAPVDDLLAYIASELPKLEAEARVTKLVSKWNASELKKYANAEQVDVTMKLVDAFQPSDQQRKYAIEIQKREPR